MSAVGGIRRSLFVKPSNAANRCVMSSRSAKIRSAVKGISESERKVGLVGIGKNTFNIARDGSGRHRRNHFTKQIEADRFVGSIPGLMHQGLHCSNKRPMEKKSITSID